MLLVMQGHDCDSQAIRGPESLRTHVCGSPWRLRVTYIRIMFALRFLLGFKTDVGVNGSAS
jgi:hypothetical protein